MKKAEEIERLKLMLARIADPRDNQGKRHKLVDILFISLVAMIAGADDAAAIEEFGEINETWFTQMLALEHGIPSQDTYLRLYAVIDPAQLQATFREWVEQDWRQTRSKGHIAIDGKTLRRSFDTASGGKAIHMVSAWLSEDGLVLGQQAVAEKSNEITAIPELLRLLDVNGATVTIDAMGCQRAIAEQIVDCGANYILAVKDNQPKLHEAIEACFADAERKSRALDDPSVAIEVATQTNAGHGRIEERICKLTRDLSWIDQREDWKGLAAIAQVQSTRTDKLSGKSSTETRSFIVSHKTASAARVLQLVRLHWGIENRLHWVLDVSFDEDLSRIRAGHAAENFAVVRHVAVNMLRAVPLGKKSLALRRKRCGWDRDYLLSVLAGAKEA
jgi:predicted transposase YbfD/YdcC